MSDNIPLEIQVEIIKRVHLVKSLLRFRSVSNQYKSLIDSSQFITDHCVNQTQPHHLLVAYADDYDDDDDYYKYKYVSVVDDGSFPQHKFVTNVPPTIKVEVRMLDSSHGLVCLYGHTPDLSLQGAFSVVLWNPSIRKSVGILLPDEYYYQIVGFGVCPKTCDPKIVAIMPSRSAIHPDDWEALVFTLSSRAWRSVSVKLPLTRIDSIYNQVLIDGVIHWLPYELETGRIEMILLFDLTSEEFGQVHLPNSLADSTNYMSISKCKESLVVLDHGEEVCDVWMMTKNGDLEYSFAKLYSISFQVYDDGKHYGIIGFTKNGQPLKQYEHPFGRNDYSVVTTLEAYEPSTESSIGLITAKTDFLMTSYKESLLLLNHSDSIIR